MRLSREAILEAKDRDTVEVDCPEWGGTVLVRGMTGRERDAFETSMVEQRGRGAPTQNLSNVRAKLVARCVVDDDGERLFTDADVAALGDKSAAPVDRIFEVASRLSGIGDQDMKEMARDFSLAPGSGSSSPSRGNSARQPKGS